MPQCVCQAGPFEREPFHLDVHILQVLRKSLEQLFLFFIHFIIYLFIWLRRVLVAACGVFHCGADSLLWRTGCSLVVVCRFFLSLVVACGFSLLWLWCTGSRGHGLCSLRHTGSLGEVRGLTCPTTCGILVPRPGIEPASPALEGGFFTTGPPGKSLAQLFLDDFLPSCLSESPRRIVFGHLDCSSISLPFLFSTLVFCSAV